MYGAAQVLESMALQPARGPKRRRLQEEYTEVLAGVRAQETSEDTLAQRLTKYVERVDTDMVRYSCIAKPCTSVLELRPLTIL